MEGFVFVNRLLPNYETIYVFKFYVLILDKMLLIYFTLLLLISDRA